MAQGYEKLTTLSKSKKVTTKSTHKEGKETGYKQSWTENENPNQKILQNQNHSLKRTNTEKTKQGNT